MTRELLGAQVRRIVLVRDCDQRNATNHLDPMGAEPVDLRRVVRHQAYAPDAERPEHFGGDGIVPSVFGKAEQTIGLERVIPALLERISSELICEPDPASLLPEIEKHAGGVAR